MRQKSNENYREFAYR
ncbi:hypothetical protein RDI58_027340 [Solanum bulbocastanum]|uniref:Uncharacterized protein n=1 Tax=Solanum bulbocastanum TaxID=147425 RepID=A0AAN8SVV3_SOLBU